MTEHHAFRFSNVGMTKGRALVELDGQDISDVVKGMAVDAGSRETPRVMVELMAPEQDITVEETEIQLPAKMTDLLLRLGWLPPEQAKAIEQDLDDHRRTLENLRAAEVKRVSEQGQIQ